MKIAQYKSLEGGYVVIDEVCGYREGPEFARVSEVIEVEFVKSVDADTTKKEIAFIDSQIKTVQAAAQGKLNELEKKKAELLALPSPSV